MSHAMPCGSKKKKELRRIVCRNVKQNGTLLEVMRWNGVVCNSRRVRLYKMSRQDAQMCSGNIGGVEKDLLSLYWCDSVVNSNFVLTYLGE